MSMHLIRRPFVILVGLALLLALSGFLAPPPARATGPLTISFLHCESGASQFMCDSTVSGGTGSYSGYWQASNVWYFTSVSAYLATGVCAAGNGVSMSQTVWDSAGAKASSSTYFYCSASEWP